MQACVRKSKSRIWIHAEAKKLNMQKFTLLYCARWAILAHLIFKYPVHNSWMWSHFYSCSFLWSWTFCTQMWCCVNIKPFGMCNANLLPKAAERFWKWVGGGANYGSQRWRASARRHACAMQGVSEGDVLRSWSFFENVVLDEAIWCTIFHHVKHVTASLLGSVFYFRTGR